MASADMMSGVLLAVPVVILACRASAAMIRRLGQPAVVGEIVVGILFGPSLLGWLSPGAQHWLFPNTIAPFVDVLGQLGLISFMFLVGLELDLGSLQGNGRVALVVSQVSIAFPMVLGGLLALAMYRRFAPTGVSTTSFVLFIAVSMSITAFPVLARILTERGMYGTPTGTLAMACAAIDDVTAWCLLALVVAIAGSTGPMGAIAVVGLTAAFAAVMLWGVRPLLTRWAGRAARATEQTVMVLLFSGLCASALVTDRIGVHAMFGAFLFGVVTPRRTAVVERSANRLRAVAVPLLLPLFFVQTGLRTDFGALSAQSGQWPWAGAVIAVAVVSKGGVSAVASRAAGSRWRDALMLGSMMNCRGLTELVVLNIGLELGVIGPSLFTILVLMALLTTAATGPALKWLSHRVDAARPRRSRRVESRLD